MGYGWDEAIECDEIEIDLNQCEWRDQKGGLHQIENMKESHIKNILNRIRQNRFNDQWLDLYGEKWKEVFESELMRRKAV